MIFTRLTIENFGVYRGQNEFDLRPQMVDDQSLPVVLFGGKNGSGKTTILDAIRLCLHGQLAIGSRVRRSDYEAYIDRHMHRDSLGMPVSNRAQISIQFEHTHVGVCNSYNATRAWRIDNDGFKEDVTIYKDGGLLEDTTADHWNDFLRDLIPPGVANLFFFDGEEIHSLADDESETESLQIAVKGLLNLDLVGRLKADLSQYLDRKGEKGRTELEKIAHDAEVAYQALEEERLILVEDKASLRTQLDGISNRLEKSRQALLSEGAIFVKEKTQNEARIKQIDVEKEETVRAIQELAADLLPFAVAPSWNHKLKERLSLEAKLEEARITRDVQQERAAEIAIKFLDKKFQKKTAPEVSSQDWASIATEVQKLMIPDECDVETPILHTLSTQQREKLTGWIDSSLNDIPDKIDALTTKLDNLEQEARELNRAIKQAPDEEVASPLINEFQDLSTQRGELEARSKQLEKEISSFEHQHAELERQRKKAWQNLAGAEDTDIRIQRAAKVQIILDEYLEKITEVKLTELEQMIAHYFNLLCRKKTAVTEVRIDRQRFIVRLYGKNRVELPKPSLSKGEQQLYAMALLWALRSVSGRNLPIIIDTPMARLDGTHRHTLLTRFLPEAAHQIIILSTDKEIDADAHDLLKPYVSHSFALDFDQEAGHTKKRDGYFTDKEFANVMAEEPLELAA